MTRLRPVLGPIALGWLVCQLTTLTLVPVAVMISATSISAEQKCQCPAGAHTSQCPMHKTPAGSQCLLRSADSTGGAALVPFLGLPGFIPTREAVIDPPLSDALALVEPGAAIRRLLSPDTPPPRA